MSIILDADVVAKYVLQVNLSYRHKVSNHLGSIMLWRKGGLFGQADEMMKLCSQNGCKGFFRDSFYLTPEELEVMAAKGVDAENPGAWPSSAKARYNHWFSMLVVCPLCGAVSVREDLPDSYGFSMSKDRIAACMARFFELLNHEADVYLVHVKKDAGFQNARTELKGDRQRYARLLDEARTREQVYYGLKDVLKDTSAAGLEGRFRSLLGA